MWFLFPLALVLLLSSRHQMTTFLVLNDKVFTKHFVLNPHFEWKRVSFDYFLMTTWKRENESQRKKKPQIPRQSPFIFKVVFSTIFAWHYFQATSLISAESTPKFCQVKIVQNSVLKMNWPYYLYFVLVWSSWHLWDRWTKMAFFPSHSVTAKHFLENFQEMVAREMIARQQGGQGRGGGSLIATSRESSWEGNSCTRDEKWYEVK